MAEWEDELGRWLKPFLDRLGHKTRQRMCPLYVAGLIGPGDRKSVQPMAERIASGNYDQLHHFIADGVWDATPLESELLNQADRLVGGKDAVLVIDDTAMPKKANARLLSRLNMRPLLAKRQIAKRCVADTRARRSARDGRIASLSSRELDRRSVSFEACSRADRIPGGTIQAGNCFGRG